MQVKIFTIPIHGGEAQEAELNAFLRGKKILQVAQELVPHEQGGNWTFCVRYLEGVVGNKRTNRREKKDYKSMLSAEAFERFTALRKARKTLADEDAIPAFAIFTDEQMASLAQQEELTPQTMRVVDGIGEKKTAKYAERLQAIVKW